MDIILKYFPNLSEVQQQQFAALYDLYTDWNSKIKRDFAKRHYQPV